MDRKKQKLVVVAGMEFHHGYAGTQYLLEQLAETFAVEAYVYARPGSTRWYRAMPFRCRVFPFNGSRWNLRRLRILDKVFRAWVWLRMLGARQVLVTETAYLREAAWVKRIKGARLVLTQFCQELYLTEEYPQERMPRLQKRLARIPDIVIDVEPHRAQVRMDYYRLGRMPYVLRNTFPRRQLPPPAPRGGLWKLAGIPPPAAGIPVLVHAGTIGQEKPFARIVEALAAVSRPVFLLVFCTSGPEVVRQCGEAAAARLPPGSYCIRPSVSRDQLRASLWEADIGLVDYAFAVEPTTNQRYCEPTKLYEYMACGLALLGSGNIPLREVIETEGIGLCAESDAPRDLGAALNRLLAGDLAGMKAKARAAYQEKYSYEKLCAEVVRAIADDMVRRSRDRGGPPA